MNYAILTIRLIGQPEYKHTEDSIPYIEILGSFYQPRNNKSALCRVIVWGNLVGDLVKYYTHDDYLFVEGHVSLEESVIEDLKTEIEIAAYKIYPYALKSVNTNNNFF